MSISIREAVRITPEVTPGVFDATATTTVRHIALTAGNVFTGRPTPRPFVLRDAGSSNRRVQTGFGSVGTDLRLRTPLWYSQVSLLPFWCTPTGTPWELPTFTLDHYMLLEGSTTAIYSRYLGCTGETLALTGDNSPQGSVVMADMTFAFLAYDGTITVTDFPEPTFSVYPWPTSIALMQHGAGNLSLGGSSRTGWNKFSISYKNVLAKVYDESTYPQVISWRGRDVDFSFNLRHKTNADRVKFLAMTANAATFSFTDSTTTVAFDFKSQNFLTGVADDTPLNDVHRQGLDYAAYVTAASTDATLTITP
jgi:hypothetical protein